MRVVTQFKDKNHSRLEFENVTTINLDEALLGNKVVSMLRLRFKAGGDTSFPISCLCFVEEDK